MDAMNLRFVVAAYAVAWAVMGSYALYVHATLRRAREMFERSGDRAKGES